MEADIKEKLLKAGVDVEDALKRFLGNETLLFKFLKMFSVDENYELFRKSMEEKKYEDAFKAAHALKGLCGNLSLNSLCEVISSEVELLRNGRNEEAENFMPDVVKEYNKILEVLKDI